MTLKEAIEKVGVGGKVTNPRLYSTYTVLFVGTYRAFLRAQEGGETSEFLSYEGWTPVLPKKRVVLQAWQYTGVGGFKGGIMFFEPHKNEADHLFKPREDIPDMIVEDGKWVFDADA